MFQRLKKVLTQDKNKTPDSAITTQSEVSASSGAHLQPGAPEGQGDPAPTGAGTRSGSVRRVGNAGAVQGLLHDRPWRLERAAASRDYIMGKELRGSADIAVDTKVSVIIMNRPLKELLEKRAYAMYTDSVETVASPTLMEEMRWLAIYPQVGWTGLPDSFWHRYAVMTSRRAHGMGWVTPELADLLMTWHESASAAEVPFILMVMRGKVRLRMQLTPDDAATLNRITRLFETAAQSAIDVFTDASGQPARSPKR